MGQHLTVSEVCVLKGGIRPQIVNKWVSDGLPTVGERPRKIDVDVMEAWLAQREQTKPARVPGGNKASKDPNVIQARQTSIMQQLLEDERRMLAWSRGKGRGWALARPAQENQPVIANYLELVKDNGQIHGAKWSSLMKEAKDGHLFFLEPVQVTSFLLAQLVAVRNEHSSIELDRAVTSMQRAFEQLTLWRESRQDSTGVSSTDIELMLEEGEAFEETAEEAVE